MRLRDGDGLLVGLFSGRGIGRVALEQDVTTDAMKEGVRPVFTPVGGSTYRLVDRVGGSAKFFCVRFALREQPKKEWTVDLGTDFCKACNRLPEFGANILSRKFRARPS